MSLGARRNRRSSAPHSLLFCWRPDDLAKHSFFSAPPRTQVDQRRPPSEKEPTAGWVWYSEAPCCHRPKFYTFCRIHLELIFGSPSALPPAVISQLAHNVENQDVTRALCQSLSYCLTVTQLPSFTFCSVLGRGLCRPTPLLLLPLALSASASKSG